MELIKPSFSIWEQPAGLEGVYKQIERVGRVCYKSEDKITEDSSKPFVNRLINSKHYAMLEHGTVYLAIPVHSASDVPHDIVYNKYTQGKRVYTHGHEGFDAITTNYRVLVENDWLNLLQYRCEPTDDHEKRVTVHFVCDRGVSHEFVRHRVMSFAQESTRYCNYSKDKFGNELTFIIPNWTNIKEGHYDEKQYSNDEYYTDYSPEYSFMIHLFTAEATYLKLLKEGWKPQEARTVLPNSLKTELVVTGFTSDWERLFRLRSRIAETGKPHPQAQELADPLMDEFVKRGIMETLL